MDDDLRGTGARSALSGICREVGYPPDQELMQMLRACEGASAGQGVAGVAAGLCQ